MTLGEAEEVTLIFSFQLQATSSRLLLYVAERIFAVGQGSRAGCQSVSASD